MKGYKTNSNLGSFPKNRDGLPFARVHRLLLDLGLSAVRYTFEESRGKGEYRSGSGTLFYRRITSHRIVIQINKSFLSFHSILRYDDQSEREKDYNERHECKMRVKTRHESETGGLIFKLFRQ